MAEIPPNYWQIAAALGGGVGRGAEGLMGLAQSAADKYQAIPSWADQAMQFASRDDPHTLLSDPAYTKFTMGMVGPASTKLTGTSIADHLANLQNAKTNVESFNNAFSALRADKTLTKADMDALAHQYTGGREKWPTKGQAVDAIQRVFNERQYQSVKMLQVDKASKF